MRPYMTETPIIALDFDGVIMSGTDFTDMSQPPVEGAIETIKALKEMGCEIILWTSRVNKGMLEAIDYLKKHDIFDCFSGFNAEAPSTPFKQGRKIFAHYYVDDLNLGGFSGYSDLLETVTQDLKEFKEHQNK